MCGIIRLATPQDSSAILNIYAPYITDTAITFETEVPDCVAFAMRIEAICKQFPYLVYLIDNVIVGYAYASSHRERQAYCYDVDVSIYIEPRYHGSGAAVTLYKALFALLNELGYCNAYAGFTVPNEKSRRFHERFGFTYAGTFHKTGYKLGKWHDVTWLEKSIQEHLDEPKKIKSVSDLQKEYMNAIFTKYID